MRMSTPYYNKQLCDKSLDNAISVRESWFVLEGI